MHVIEIDAEEGGLLGFYRRLGWRVLGEGFLTDTGIPHHVVVLEI